MIPKQEKDNWTFDFQNKMWINQEIQWRKSKLKKKSNVHEITLNSSKLSTIKAQI